MPRCTSGGPKKGRFVSIWATFCFQLLKRSQTKTPRRKSIRRLAWILTVATVLFDVPARPTGLGWGNGLGEGETRALAGPRRELSCQSSIQRPCNAFIQALSDHPPNAEQYLHLRTLRLPSETLTGLSAECNELMGTVSSHLQALHNDTFTQTSKRV